MQHIVPVSAEQLEAGLDLVRAAPKVTGTLEMIVRRPGVDLREVLTEAELDLENGLVGDNWKTRGSRSTPDGSAHPDQQLNIMSARAIALVAPDRERWALAGDQLFVDLDLSQDNLPAGTRLAIGSAIIEITPVPHLGCAKFAQRFGETVRQFVNLPVGRQLRLRGLNARIVQPGRIRVGDRVQRLVRVVPA